MNTFDRLSRRVASEFLNTVVIVDDQAILGISQASEPARVLKTPGRQGGSVNARIEGSGFATDSAHRLDAKILIDSFARKGVLCAVLRPREQELGKLKIILSPMTGSSDVVVIDWVLHEFKQGEKTIEIIKQLLKSSGTDRGRARLIVVYTGETDLNQVANSIRKSLKLPDQGDSTDPFTIERGAARICIYAKEQSRLPANMKTRIVKTKRLPEIVVSEFANMTRGLVCNVALSSLAALRANTHQLLRRFHHQIDPPYVALPAI